jgi:hypothetical protein
LQQNYTQKKDFALFSTGTPFGDDHKKEKELRVPWKEK